MRRAWRAFAGTVLAVTAAVALGHHSAAMFDNTKVLTLTGTVREFQWTSPHCYIQLLQGGTPVPEEWSLEMAAPMYLYRLGWRPSTLKAGDKITVRLNPLRDGSHGGLLVQATTPDGRQLGSRMP